MKPLARDPNGDLALGLRSVAMAAPHTNADSKRRRRSVDTSLKASRMWDGLWRALRTWSTSAVGVAERQHDEGRPGKTNHRQGHPGGASETTSSVARTGWSWSSAAQERRRAPSEMKVVRRTTTESWRACEGRKDSRGLSEEPEVRSDAVLGLCGMSFRSRFRFLPVTPDVMFVSPSSIARKVALVVYHFSAAFRVSFVVGWGRATLCLIRRFQLLPQSSRCPWKMASCHILDRSLECHGSVLGPTGGHRSC